jgi:ribosomal protein L11 methyltransferase
MPSTLAASLVLPEHEAQRVADALLDATGAAADAVDVHEESPGAWRVTAYFARRDETVQSAVATVVARLTGNGATPAWTTLPDADWVRRSQEALPAVRAGRVLVHGGHARREVRPNDRAILIEAGQAFGTGHHATTRACLLAIQAVAKARCAGSALDVGTGSGVLAIALAKTGTRVLATDIDPLAIRIARDNARLNGVAARLKVRPMPQIPARLPVGGRARYDLVVANILLGPFLTLAPAIARHTAPNGAVILSGLLPDQRKPIVAAYRALGLRLRRWFIHDGWLAVVMDRPRKIRSPGRRAAARSRPRSTSAPTRPRYL